MIVITDSNVIISALISPKGTIAKVFKAKSQIQFFAPTFIFTEIENHFDVIKENSSLSEIDLKIEFEFLKTRIQFISEYDIPKKYILIAYEIVKDIDKDDVFFIALNRYKHYKIWTLDRVLKNGVEKKGYHIFVSTKDLLKKLYKKIN